MSSIIRAAAGHCVGIAPRNLPPMFAWYGCPHPSGCGWRMSVMAGDQCVAGEGLTRALDRGDRARNRGPDFIMITECDDSQPDMYVQHDDKPAPAADLEFIAAARNAILRLIAEVRRHREG
jgi:hypothetical protein